MSSQKAAICPSCEVCECCGLEIEEEGQKCAARDDEQADGSRENKVPVYDKERGGLVEGAEGRDVFLVKHSDETEEIVRENMQYLAGTRFEVRDGRK